MYLPWKVFPRRHLGQVLDPAQAKFVVCDYTIEMQAIEPESWQARPTDFDFLISQEAREIIEQEGIVLLSYRPLQKVWQERCSNIT